MERTIKKYYPVIAASILMLAGLYVAFPIFKYYVDPDATSYFTIAKRYAAGDYARAVNGYWSPLGSWLTALLIKANLPAMLAAITVNGGAALGFLLMSHLFFLFFNVERKLQWAMNMSIAIFLVYAVYWQLFDDLWMCFLLLAILRIMLMPWFSEKPVLWVLSGILAALAYYAKAYSFSFFILGILCCTYFLCKTHGGKWKRGLFLKICFVAIGTMVLCCAPWFVLLHEKYSIWTTSTAVSLNSSWSLVGHPLWKEGIGGLLPPIYDNSVSYWEDPYWVNGVTPHFWNSFSLFFMQIVRSGYMLLRLVNNMNEISCFFIPSWLLALGIVISKKARDMFPNVLFVPAFAFLLFPAGLVFINSETRYIWFMLPLSMLISAVGLQRLLLPSLKGIFKTIVILFFSISYLVMPILNFKEIYKAGAEDNKIATELKDMHVSGSFTSNAALGPETQSMSRIAYFSGNAYYNIPYLDISKSELLKEMRRYHVRYYFYCCKPIDAEGFVFTDEDGKAIPEISEGKFSGIKIFQLY